MCTFQDDRGRTFGLQVNVTSLKEIKRRLQIDLLTLLDGDNKPLTQLVGNPVKLVDALYLLCKEDCDAQGISDEDFGRGLGGGAIERATDAFLQALIDFFPRSQRTLMRELLAKSDEATARILQTGIDRLNSEKTNQLFDVLVQEAGNDLDKEIDRLIAQRTAGSRSPA